LNRNATNLSDGTIALNIFEQDLDSRSHCAANMSRDEATFACRGRVCIPVFLCKP
jgi:hypothetical protein